jgi:hypothetical protein
MSAKAPSSIAHGICWDRSQARSAVGGGFPDPPFRLRGGITNSAIGQRFPSPPPDEFSTLQAERGTFVTLVLVLARAKTTMILPPKRTQHAIADMRAPQ